MKSINEDKLKQILIEVLDLEEDKEIKNLQDIELIEDELEWDSLAKLSLIAACESEFGIVFEISDYEEIDSINKLKEVLKRYDL